jgi:hypothetical protein
MPVGFWKLLYLCSAASLVACVMSAHWNVLAAHRVDDWSRRHALFEATRRAALRYRLGFALLIGVFANLTAASLGLRFSTDAWLRWIDCLWIATLGVLALVDLPASRALVREARRALAHGPSAGYERALDRWRIGNSTLLLLSVASIGLMMLRWRS